jgi:uroporphyrinogen decarboxylase
MNSRERVQRAIRFQKPDRVPIAHGVLPAAQYKYGPALDAILAESPDDFGWSFMEDMQPKDYPSRYQPGKHYDEFGTLWHCETPGMAGIPVEFPLANWSAYATYRWPTPDAKPAPGRLHSAHLEGYDDRWYARGGLIKFFEQLEQLRGMENFLMDIALEPPEYRHLLDDMLDFSLRRIDNWLTYQYDSFVFADDWGGQRHLLISPKTWRRVFKPAYAAMFQKVKAKGWNMHLHSDGMILDIIPDLIEIGVDVLNCQATVIGLEALRDFAGKVCFRTDLDRQNVLPFGSPVQVKEHVHEVFEALGTPEGGLIAFGEIGPDVPLENVQAMYEAFAEYGQY